MEHNCVFEVLTTAEAGERWGKSPITLKDRCKDGRWLPGEYRRAGRDWLISSAAMERVYGAEKNILKNDEKPLDDTSRAMYDDDIKNATAQTGRRREGE